MSLKCVREIFSRMLVSSVSKGVFLGRGQRRPCASPALRVEPHQDPTSCFCWSMLVRQVCVLSPQDPDDGRQKKRSDWGNIPLRKFVGGSDLRTGLLAASHSWRRKDSYPEIQEKPLLKTTDGLFEGLVRRRGSNGGQLPLDAGMDADKPIFGSSLGNLRRSQCQSSSVGERNWPFQGSVIYLVSKALAHGL